MTLLRGGLGLRKKLRRMRKQKLPAGIWRNRAGSLG